MSPEIKNLIESLVQLDKEIQKLEEALKDMRVEIHNVFWESIELRKNTRPKPSA